MKTNNTETLQPSLNWTATRQLNFQPELHIGEINEGEDQTVPNQALSINEIITKFSQGLLPELKQYDEYDGEDEVDFSFIDPTLSPDFDLSDTDNIDEYINYLNELKSDLNKPKASDESTQQISDKTTETEQEE